MKELLIKFEDFKREENLTQNEALNKLDEFASYLNEEIIQETLDFITEKFCVDDLKFNNY